MPKRKVNIKDFILDDVEVDDGEEEDSFIGDEEDSEETDTSEPAAKRVKKKAKSKKAPREERVAAADRESRELAQLIKETEQREKNRAPRNIFAGMTVEQLQAYAREHYGENPDEEGEPHLDVVEEEEEDDDDEEEEEEDADDYFENVNNSGYLDELTNRCLKLWMVKCRRRRERTTVRKICRMAKTLKPTKNPLRIDAVFFHHAVDGFYWVEAAKKDDVVDALRASRVTCVDKNIKMMQSHELSRAYNPRPKPSREPVSPVLPAVKNGMSVKVTDGEHEGCEGMVIEMDEDDGNITVLCVASGKMDMFTVSRKQLEIQDRLF